MRGRPARAPGSASPNAPLDSEPTPATHEKYFGKVFRNAERGIRPFDMDRYRLVFPELWADFLRLHFRGDPLYVATFFGVTTRTAENWLEGKGRATGDRVAIIAAMDPAGFAAAFAPDRAA